MANRELTVRTPEDLAALEKALSLASDPADVRTLTIALERYLVGANWQEWLRRIYPQHVPAPFAEHHIIFWSWVWRLRRGVDLDPLVAVWPRGGAKSTSAELAVVACGARAVRRYVLYVCDTQDQADDHVGNIADLLGSDKLASLYPALTMRQVGRYGSSRGWRRNRLRTAAGLIVDAIGLDTAARGVKIEDARPDLIVLDDLDDALDGPRQIRRKETALTKTILPAGADSLAVLVVQNLVHIDSIVSRIVDGRADYLRKRTVSGPTPAVRNLITQEDDEGRWVIVSGEATWEGQNLAACQREMDRFGISAFLTECQHEVTVPAGGMFNHVTFRHCAAADVPDLTRVEVWCDPAVTSTDDSDSQAVQVDGMGADGRIYRLASWEQRTSPLVAMRKAILWAYEFGAGRVGVETDQGGDTWQSVYREAGSALLGERPALRDLKAPSFVQAKAGAGYGPKAHRASQMLADYERLDGRIVHVLAGQLPTGGMCTGPADLERALHRFPRTPPLDLTDAAFWSWRALRQPAKGRTRTAASESLPDSPMVTGSAR